MTCTDSDLAHYRGLVYKTAFLQLGLVEDELDDIVQVLYVKVWRAVESFDPARARRKPGEPLSRTRDRYVFSCLTCAVKDLRKKKRRGTLSIEDVAGEYGPDHGNTRDRFEARYLCVTSEVVYHDVEDDELTSILPNTLSPLEVSVLTLLAEGYKQAEAARLLEIERRHMERIVRSLRSKLADWAPSAPEAPAGEVVPFPVAGVGNVPMARAAA